MTLAEKIANILENQIHDLHDDSALAVAWALITKLGMTQEWAAAYDTISTGQWRSEIGASVKAPEGVRVTGVRVTKQNPYHRNERLVTRYVTRWEDADG